MKQSQPHGIRSRKMLINQLWYCRFRNHCKNFHPKVISFLAHSWFATLVDSNELGPVYPFQLKQLKYEDPYREGAVGATMDIIIDFGI